MDLLRSQVSFSIQMHWGARHAGDDMHDAHESRNQRCDACHDRDGGRELVAGASLFDHLVDVERGRGSDRDGSPRCTFKWLTGHDEVRWQVAGSELS